MCLGKHGWCGGKGGWGTHGLKEPGTQSSPLLVSCDYSRETTGSSSVEGSSSVT